MSELVDYAVFSMQVNDAFRKETEMQKEYEYKANGGLGPRDIADYDPCYAEFGKFTKWFYSLGGSYSSEQIVAKLVEEKRFGWLDWLAEHTPFVTRTEKKPAYKFTPENLKIEYQAGGKASLKMKNTSGEWLFIFKFVPGELTHRELFCDNLPVPMNGGQIAVD